MQIVKVYLYQYKQFFTYSGFLENVVKSVSRIQAMAILKNNICFYLVHLNQFLLLISLIHYIWNNSFVHFRLFCLNNKNGIHISYNRVYLIK